LKNTDPNPWRDVSAARITRANLVVLALLRARTNIRIHLQDDFAWVTWSGDNRDIVQCLLADAGVRFFTKRGDTWFTFRSLLPVSEAPPRGDGLALSSVLFPKLTAATQPGSDPLQPTSLRLVRSTESKPTSALVCSLRDLQRWSDMATSMEISRIKGARTRSRAILLGSQLPSLSTATRYWGESVFVPIGFRPEPNLPVPALRQAIGTDDHDFLFLNEEGVLLVPGNVFEPLTRAGMRLAIRET
jgi:hypothetical protein